MKWVSIFIFIMPLYFIKTGIFCSNGVVHCATNIQFAKCNDSLTWIDDFKLFRTAVYNKDVATVKKYFKFPLLNAGNEIWYLVLTEKEYKNRDISANKGLVAFTEEDFIKYYNKIFTDALVKSILKVQTPALYKNNAAETPEQMEGNYTKYKMYANYDDETKILTLNLAYYTILKNRKGIVEENGESNVIYNFTIESNHIFFKEIRLAG